MPGRPNNAVVVDVSARRIRTLTRYVDEKTTIAINGRKLTLAEVLATYQESLDSRADLAQKRAAVKVAMARRAAADAARREVDQALRAWVANEFGIESKEAIDVGFPPPRKPVFSVETKARAVAKRRATRAARHTMGKRQREEIRGAIEMGKPSEVAGADLSPTHEPDDGGLRGRLIGVEGSAYLRE